MAPISYATRNSSAGVSLLVKTIFSPGMPLALLKSSSGSDEQSAPNPRAASLFMIEGFGHAFTAKKLVKPGAQEKAS